MKVLFIGDIVGKSGRNAVKGLLPKVVDKYKVDFVAANGENAAGGFGITEKVASELFDLGIDVITSGNHIWDKKEAVQYIAREKRLLRPINYPPRAPGAGSVVHTSKNGAMVAVMNISGRVFMANMDCPFRTFDSEIEHLREKTKNIIVDFHAEATSEKIAFGYYADGRVSAVIGTHTHVQTADETILQGGAAYITDIGMTGPAGTVIGVKKELILERFLTLIPVKFETGEGPAVFSAAVIEIEEDTGKCSGIKRLMLNYP